MAKKSAVIMVIKYPNGVVTRAYLNETGSPVLNRKDALMFKSEKEAKAFIASRKNVDGITYEIA